MGTKPKEVRKAAKLSVIAAAVYAGVSETTCRLYEADPGAVSPPSRAKLDAYYARLARAPSDPPPTNRAA
ncbi:MAG: hypothetical protein ABI551_20910 [Polyangiaceae bacterium]